jgi:hypothetical protein
VSVPVHSAAVTPPPHEQRRSPTDLARLMVGRVPPIGAHVAGPTQAPPLRRGERTLAVAALPLPRHELRWPLGVVAPPVAITSRAPPAGSPQDRPSADCARGLRRAGAQRAAGPLVAVAIPVLVASPTPAPAPLPGGTGALADQARNSRLGELLHGPPTPSADYRLHFARPNVLARGSA